MSTYNSPILDLGRNARGSNERVIVELNKLENFFFLMLGKSGAGKSHTIRQIIDQLFGYSLRPTGHQWGQPTFHILGYHPDFDYQFFEEGGANTNVRPESINKLNLNYIEGDTSINLLAPLIDNDSYRYRTIEDFCSFAKIVHPSLGIHQLRYLRETLDNLYRIITHKEDRLPDISDLFNEIKHIKNCLQNGLSGDINRKLGKLRDKRASIEKLLRGKKLDTKQKDEKQAELDEMKDELIEEFGTLVHTNAVWMSDEYFKDFDLSTIKTLESVVVEMIRPGFFDRKGPARPQPGMINFYDIHKLEDKHLNLMTHVLLSRLYHGAVARTPKELMNPAYAHTFIVGDEMRYLESATKEKSSPGNLIMGGGRKFGMGGIFGGQGADQLSDDMARAFSLKVIMAQNEAAYRDAEKYFRVKEAMLRKVEPKKSAIVKFGDNTALTNLFV